MQQASHELLNNALLISRTQGLPYIYSNVTSVFNTLLQTYKTDFPTFKKASIYPGKIDRQKEENTY